MEKEDMDLLSKDSDSSSSEDSPVDSSSFEEENAPKAPDRQDEGDLWGGTSKPSVTELWPKFRPGKTLRFLQLFEPQKKPSVWEKVRKRMRRKKDQRRQHHSEPSKGGPQLGRPPEPEECLTDDEIKMMAPVPPQTASQHGTECPQHPPSEEVAPWRYGPAKLWYDMLNIPPDGKGFDYGFKLKEKSQEEEEEEKKEKQATHTDNPLLEDENFLMVTQKSWEDDIIWDNRDFQEPRSNDQKAALAGWIPSEKNRLLKTDHHDISQPGGSIFIPENEDLIYGQWEDNIIWDAQAMTKPLYPPVLTLDVNDENLLLVDVTEPVETETPAPKSLTLKGSSTKNQIMLKCGIMEMEEVEQPPVRLRAKDPWNLSNDEFYFPQQHNLEISMTVPIVQHSIPALKLHSSLFPTYMEDEQLRLFHRPPLKWTARGPQPVQSLTCYIQKKAQERLRDLQASGGGHMFFMKTIQDLSGKDGDLILMEWSEENPPLLNQVGMASHIQNYYKRKIGKDTGPPAYKYGNPVLCSSSPFLGKFHAGQFLQAIENKLFRAPIYPHQMADTDFLVVMTKEGCFLREVKDIFTVGQQCPLDEVPAPNSKMAKDYIHGFLQVFVYRQFWKSPFRPRRIRMEHIRQAFPKLPESSIRRRLTRCADFHRTGLYFNWWVLKSGFRLPSEEEMRAMMTPEKCCALYSMLAAHQRLKDAGYGEVSLLDTEEISTKDACLEEEIQAAPWNTTRAFLAATKGQCLLEVTGAADPTGCGEGVSYVKLKQENKPRLDGGRLMGTDADLRRLTLKKAQKLLRIFGVSEEEIKKLSRWEVIAAVRALSTKELNAGANSRDLTKFARTSQSSAAEQQRRFQQEIQRVFDLQNRVLASTDVLSTDTDSETSDEENTRMLDNMSQEIEDLLDGKTNPQKLQRQKENQEYQELRQLMLRENGGACPQEKDRGPTTSRSEFLVIYRTYADESGKEYVRTEIVRDPVVIKVYIQVKTTKNEDSIWQICADEQRKQELRKEKKRLQDQLRRIRIAKKKKKEKKQLSPGKLPKTEASKLNQLVCGACGSLGHIKTNKTCPKYCPPKDLGPRLKVMSQEQEERLLAKRLPKESLIKVQETKIFMNKKLFETMNEVQRETLKVRVEKQPQNNQKNPIPHQKRKSMHVDEEESLSCIRHPCQPVIPCPPSRRASSSPKPRAFPLKKNEQVPSIKSTAKYPPKIPPSPAEGAQSQPKAPSFPRTKSRDLQNWLWQKHRSLTCPQEKKPDIVARTPPSKADRIPPARESQDAPTCSKPSGYQYKRPRNSLYPPGQEETQESSKRVSQDGYNSSRQSSLLDKDSQKSDPGVPSQARIPEGPSQKHHISVLYEDLQVSDTDDEESEESEASGEENEASGEESEGSGEESEEEI